MSSSNSKEKNNQTKTTDVNNGTNLSTSHKKSGSSFNGILNSGSPTALLLYVFIIVPLSAHLNIFPLLNSKVDASDQFATALRRLYTFDPAAHPRLYASGLATDTESYAKFKLFIIFTSWALAIISLALARFYSPGRVPSSFSPDSVTSLERKSKDGQSLRFCKKCERYKPDRAHHCSKCNSCTLKMDHHCPWTGSCVGHGNYKQYLLAIQYGTICIFATWQHLFVRVRASFGDDSVLWSWPIVLCFLWSSQMLLQGILLNGLHFKLIASNYTTLEWMEKRRKENYVHPYTSPSVWDNVKVAYGRNIWAWLIPFVQADNGSGLEFSYDKKLVSKV